MSHVSGRQRLQVIVQFFFLYTKPNDFVLIAIDNFDFKMAFELKK